jgi:penicillin-binding protein 1A
MFKKFNGFNSRFKRAEKDINTPDKHDIVKEEKENYERNSTKINSSLEWPGIQSGKKYKPDYFKINKIFNIKKQFSIPGSLPASFNLSFITNNAINYIKNKFLHHKSVLLGILFGFAAAIIIVIIGIVATEFKKVRGLADFQPNITTNIYDKNGLLVAELFKQKREIVPLSKIPPVLINAFISIEDNEFYDHYGLNVKGIVRAAFINLFSGKIKQGGSTITMQLAKIILTSADKSFFRKMKDIIISLMIETIYTKNEILELYFNQIFLGHGVYGVESASKFYFNKHVWEIDLAEAALLATLPSAPNKLSPIRHTERSIERHRIVLAKMVDCGFVNIPNAEKSYLEFWPDYLAYINDLPPSITSWSNKIDNAPWFTEYLRRKLVKQFGEEMVYKEGLSVYTTLDVKKQSAAQKLLQEGLEKQATTSSSLSFKNEDYVIENFSDLTEIFSLLFNTDPYYKKGSLELKQINDYCKSEVLDELDTLNFISGNENISDFLNKYREKESGYKTSQKVQGCLISIDQRNGYIEAMVGGAEFSSINQLNRAMQSKRQAGSAIKGLLYTAAMESKKFTPASTILDSPYISLTNEGGDWIPENYDQRYEGLVRLRTALERSLNVISIKIAEELGMDTIVEYYGKLLKLDRKAIPRNLSIAIGTIDVSPFELARAYAIIANGGRDVMPYSIRFVKDRNGEIIDNPEADTQAILKKEAENGSIQIIKPETSQIMISMLRSVMTSGTGLSAAMGRPAGGKTGTSSNYRDAWFVGFTPQLTTCVWAGYDNPGLSLGQGQTGGGVVAPIWREYMKEAMENEPYLEFPYFASLLTQKVCVNSGLLPSPYCKQTIDEIFMEDTIPETECTFCKDLKYNIDTLRHSPKDNIAGGQRDSILDNIKDKKTNSSILDKVGKDLLE